MDDTFSERFDCRFCGSRNLQLYVDLGDQPPSNSFISPAEVRSERRYPLKVFLCSSCGLSQLTGIVSAKYIFDDYQYLSSVSKALVAHYGKLTASLVERFRLSPADGVLDIGCNDGIILNGYPRSFTKRVGVEPSTVALIAEKQGHTIYRDFFNVPTAERIRREQGPMAVITATNVFAHIDDIHSVVDGVRHLIADDGAFLIETPYVVDMVEKNLFDTIYHEHLCYLAVTPLNYLFNRHGMEIFNVERIDLGASGPAIRVFSQRAGGTHPRSPVVREFLDQEERWGVRAPEPYRAFAERIVKIRERLLALLAGLQRKGARLGAYGAPAKGNTLLNTFRIKTDLITEGVAETNDLKIGKLTPGSHLPIVSERDFVEKRPDYALLLSWNYLDFFLQKSDYIKAGGRFVVPLPEPAIRPAD